MNSNETVKQNEGNIIEIKAWRNTSAPGGMMSKR